jgi:hypothetical protein
MGQVVTKTAFRRCSHGEKFHDEHAENCHERNGFGPGIGGNGSSQTWIRQGLDGWNEQLFRKSVIPWLGFFSWGNTDMDEGGCDDDSGTEEFGEEERNGSLARRLVPAQIDGESGALIKGQQMLN